MMTTLAPTTAETAKNPQHADTVFATESVFLHTLSAAIYADAKEQYLANKPPFRTRALLNDPRVSDDLLANAIAILTPSDNRDAQNPTLYYLLIEFSSQRERNRKPPEQEEVGIDCFTGTKQVVRSYEKRPVKHYVPDHGDCIDQATGSTFITMNSVSSRKPGEGFNLETGSLDTLSQAFRVRAFARGSR